MCHGCISSDNFSSNSPRSMQIAFTASAHELHLVSHSRFTTSVSLQVEAYFSALPTVGLRLRKTYKFFRLFQKRLQQLDPVWQSAVQLSSNCDCHSLETMHGDFWHISAVEGLIYDQPLQKHYRSIVTCNHPGVLCRIPNVLE